MSAAVLTRTALPVDFIQRVNALTDLMDANRTAIDAVWNQPVYSEADAERACTLMDANAEMEEQLLGLLLAAGLQPGKLWRVLA